jgi:uridine phosphorylase
MREFNSSNFPLDADGRTYHVECRTGDFANRVLTVGDFQRAHRIAKLFDSITVTRKSTRGFEFTTGIYKGVPITVVSIGMGFPMADMFVREMKAVTPGNVLLVRFGSCGSIMDVPAGVVCVAKGSCLVTRNYSKWSKSGDQSAQNPYNISPVFPADPELSEKVISSLEKSIGQDSVFSGINASADSFYSSQGRIDPNFDDCNDDIINKIREQYPDCETFEMETGMLFHLASCCKSGRIRAAACAMTFFQRSTSIGIDVAKVPVLEEQAGKAILEALINTQI